MTPYNNLFGGVRIIFSTNAQEQTSEPLHVHAWNGKKESKQYHWRVQKKWLKRWGYIYKPCIYQTPEGFIAHPSYKAEIERQCQERPQ